MSLGNNIKKYRKLNKLTQEELAEKVGMSKTTIVFWESKVLAILGLICTHFSFLLLIYLSYNR